MAGRNLLNNPPFHYFSGYFPIGRRDVFARGHLAEFGFDLQNTSPKIRSQRKSTQFFYPLDRAFDRRKVQLLGREDRDFPALPPAQVSFEDLRLP